MPSKRSLSLWFLHQNSVDCFWNVMAQEQKPDFVFRRNGRVHLNRRGRQFSRLLAAEVCASAVVMLDTPRSEVVWRVLVTHSIRQFPLHFPSRASPCAITFQLDSTVPCPVQSRHDTRYPSVVRFSLHQRNPLAVHRTSGRLCPEHVCTLWIRMQPSRLSRTLPQECGPVSVPSQTELPWLRNSTLYGLSWIYSTSYPRMHEANILVRL